MASEGSLLEKAEKGLTELPDTIHKWSDKLVTGIKSVKNVAASATDAATSVKDAVLGSKKGGKKKKSNVKNPNKESIDSDYGSVNCGCNGGCGCDGGCECAGGGISGGSISGGKKSVKRRSKSKSKKVKAKNRSRSRSKSRSRSRSRK